MTRPYKPAGMPSLIPYLTVQDADKAADFYQTVCQFTFKSPPHKQDGKIKHAELTLGDAVIMMSPEGAWEPNKKAPKSTKTDPSITLYIYVPDVDAHFSHAKAKGAQILSSPENMFWGDRFYSLQDIDGYQWCFATNIGEHGPTPVA